MKNGRILAPATGPDLSARGQLSQQCAGPRTLLGGAGFGRDKCRDPSVRQIIESGRDRGLIPGDHDVSRPTDAFAVEHRPVGGQAAAGSLNPR